MEMDVSSVLPHGADGRSSYGSYHPNSAMPIQPKRMKKRKADSQDNERLSKRLSLLNLEQNGQKLYVPVESPQLKPADPVSLRQIPENDSMQLDDSKHKVYIYDLDAELSDSGESDDGRLVFIPDIQKHLRQTRIPPSVLVNKDGELAGMQMVLYSEPTSLTIPEEQDSVRRAIIEARARARRKQRGESGPESEPEMKADSDAYVPSPEMDVFPDIEERVQSGLCNLANNSPAIASHAITATTVDVSSWPNIYAADDDPDAMDMDW